MVCSHQSTLTVLYNGVGHAPHQKMSFPFCPSLSSPGRGCWGVVVVFCMCSAVPLRSAVVSRWLGLWWRANMTDSRLKWEPKWSKSSAAVTLWSVFTARCYASTVLAMSLCLSVTSRSSTKTAKQRITQTTPHDSPGTLVFWCERSPRNSPYEGTECRWGRSKSATFDK